MRSLVLVSGILLAAAITCTGPTRDFVDAPDSSSGAGGSAGASNGSASGSDKTAATGSTQASTTGAGGSACEDSTHTCLEKAPNGWAGPVALYQGDSANAAPSCALSAYPTLVADYNGMLDQGNPMCGCTCAAAANIACTAPAELCYAGMQIQSCQVMCSGTLLPPGQCTPIPVAGGTKILLTNPVPTDMGSCSPQPTKSIAPPTWGIAARACSGAPTTDVGCTAGDVCAPLGGGQFSSMCIVSPGDVSCPDAFYSKKNTFFDNFTDTRDCSACTCGSATSTCGGSVGLEQSIPAKPACTSGFMNELADGSNTPGSCADYTGSPNSATYVPAPSGSCPPMGGQLTGMVATNGASTVCCH